MHNVGQTFLPTFSSLHLDPYQQFHLKRKVPGILHQQLRSRLADLPDSETALHRRILLLMR